jgi:hypothetical protein
LIITVSPSKISKQRGNFVWSQLILSYSSWESAVRINTHITSLENKFFFEKLFRNSLGCFQFKIAVQVKVKPSSPPKYARIKYTKSGNRGALNLDYQQRIYLKKSV